MRNGENQLDVIKTALLSFLLVSFSMWLQGNIGLNIADEGYLWYGATQTALGKVPLRDFQSYDPGRYYWSAAWSFVFGNGIKALRLSAVVFQFIGLTLGLLSARRITRSYLTLTFIGILLLVWMYPRHKFFDISLAMAAIFFAVRLIEKQSLSRHFSAGVFVGLAAFFGRNHGLYCFLGFSVLIIYIWFRISKTDLIKRSGAWFAGIIVGYSPVFIMILAIPGFFHSFINAVISTSFLPLPVPWPWRVNYSHTDLIKGLHNFFIGFLFLLLPIFYLFAVINAIFTKKENIGHRTLFIASSFIGIFYMHHAFSRADFSHLAQCVHPLLLGLVSLPAAFELTRRKALLVVFASVLSIITFFAIGTASPYFMKFSSQSGRYIPYKIMGDDIWIDRGQADLLDNIKKIVAENVKPDETLLIAPHWTTLYCVLQKESPAWEIYFMFPAPEKRQADMIRALDQKNVNWVILGDVALDGRDDLRFCNTHGLVWRYLTAEFEPLNGTGLPPNYQLLHRKGVRPTPR